MFTDAAVRLNNIWWEWRLGVSTRGVQDVDHADAARYATMGYGTIWRILRHLQLESDDVFVDVGCGKGRVLGCAARHPVEHVYGVDVSPGLCGQARANAGQLRGRRAPITVRNAVAQDFDYSGATVLFMFDPFGPDTLRQVLDKVRADTEARAGAGDRGIRLAYANPTHEAMMAGEPWLKPTGRWARSDDRVEHDVMFFRAAS